MTESIQPLWRNKRVKTPTILQMEAVECGAASLAMILAGFGRLEPLEKLRQECGVSRDGSKAGNILKAARQYGLIAKGFKKEPGELNTLPLPMILFWNFNHFVVLEGIRGKKIYLNDPGFGSRVVTWTELDQSFTGVALTFECGPDFRPDGRRSSLIRTLGSRLIGSRAPLTYIVLAGLFLVVPGLVTPIFSKVFVDHVLVGHKTDWIKPLLIGMGITAVVRMILTGLQQSYLLRLQTRMALTSSARFFYHVFHLPIDFFNQRFGGEIGSRVQINDVVAQLLTGELSTNILNCVMIVFYAALMLSYDWLLTSIGICAALINLLALRVASRKRIDMNQRLMQDQGKLMGTAMSGLQMIETIKASGTESDFFSQWSGHLARVMNTRQSFALTSQLLSTMPGLLSALNTVAILGVGSLRVISGLLSMGDLVAFQSLMASFMNPVNQLVNLGSMLQEVRGDMNRLDDVLRNPMDQVFLSGPPAGAVSETVARLEGALELRSLTFGYSRLEPPLIDGFSLKLLPGQRVALVGGSGSGKSTIARLMSGLYSPWSGEILFDGYSRIQIPHRVLIQSIGMVDQDIFMFQGSIRDNLTLWDTTIPDAVMIKAAIDACIHDEISARPGGYDSMVEEGGGNFSGGQRQRLEIARTLIANPAILVLDEATSALDSGTEKQIDDHLRRRGVTCLIVAHRLSTIRDCDEIIVLDQGKVVQRGTHQEMRNVDGPYARLIQAE